MTNPMFDLSGKVAIVTGSSRGIGRSIAEELARAGARVVICARKLAPCEEVRDALLAAGHEAIALQCHVGDKAQLENLVARTLQQWGRLDICVANVAVNPFYGPISQVSDDAFDKTMGTNVRSTLWLANLAMPQIVAAGGGSFIVISSIGALRGSTGLATYNISKLAELGLTQNLAVEWGPQGVRVNAILPGVIRTDFAAALLAQPKLVAAIEQHSPLRRIGEPSDIGGIAVFLASPAGRFITGQSLVADGGATVVGPLGLG